VILDPSIVIRLARRGNASRVELTADHG